MSADYADCAEHFKCPRPVIRNTSYTITHRAVSLLCSVYRLNACFIDATLLDRANLRAFFLACTLMRIKRGRQLSTRPILIIEQKGGMVWQTTEREIKA